MRNVLKYRPGCNLNKIGQNVPKLMAQLRNIDGYQPITFPLKVWLFHIIPITVIKS